jgi:tetratricopeptide (TPR) repeat protein
LNGGFQHDARELLQDVIHHDAELKETYLQVLRQMIADPSSDDPLFYSHPLLEELCSLLEEDPQAWLQLAENRARAKDFKRAEIAALEALRFKPDTPAALAIMAEVEKERDEQTSEHDYRFSAFQADQRSLAHRRALALLLPEPQGSDLLREAIRENPYDAQARSMLAHLLLLRGRTERSTWELHEWRETAGQGHRFGGWGPVSRRLSKSLWQGEDVSGTLLVRAEQGYGDCLQFLRYLPLARQRCQKLVLAVRPRLERLARSCPGVDRVVSPPWSRVRADAEALVMRLPAFLDPEQVAVPYLFAEPVEVRRWEDILGPRRGLRVGLAWAGNPAHAFNTRRSTSLLAFRPLWMMEELEFHSLQLDSHETADVTEGRVLDLQKEQTDWASTAALMMHLDLIITVDTAVAHLAGALGRPVWLLLNHRWEEWRWGDNGETTPWYPSMRIFRKGARESWRGMLVRISGELGPVNSKS